MSARGRRMHCFRKSKNKGLSYFGTTEQKNKGYCAKNTVPLSIICGCKKIKDENLRFSPFLFKFFVLPPFSPLAVPLYSYRERRTTLSARNPFATGCRISAYSFSAKPASGLSASPEKSLDTILPKEQSALARSQASLRIRFV